ncbi:MAG: nucleotide exchange factor GrpE [Phycisphaeraceae bacterium]|nr:nucleotide exchange factor GrpE [Phycisphaeraceae bacterium]
MFGSSKDNRPRDAEPQTPKGEEPSMDPDETAALIDQLSAERDEAARQRDEAMDKWKHALADFQNYQRRAIQNEQEARRQGTIGVLHSVIPVLDHFDLALVQSAGNPGVEQVMHGVQVIRDELLKALESHGVRVINPGPNDEFDPSRHQAISTQPVEPGGPVEPGRILSTLQAGYALVDRVVRPAKVMVAAAKG